ncbi:MAG: hypothetical protein K2O01_01685, partial [Bacteroidales bacterium]|nr:hypothetical protein [Bacteroidales bacterium]
MALLLVGLGVHAQTTQSNTVYPGENGAKTVLIQKAYYGYVQFLSGDARYISGLLGGAAGFAYDIVNDTCLMYEDFTLPGFISPNHYAGQDDPGETVVNAFAYYNGTRTPLEHVLESGKPSYDDVFITAVQGNGDNLVTMVYEQYDKPSGSKGFVNIAAIHDGKTGKLKFKLPLVWNMPISGDALGFGARGDCISGDGTVVGGHSTNPFVAGKWSLAFWDISDPDNILTFGIEDEGFDFGTFYGANYDGSVLVGSSESNGQGVIVNYDKTAKKFSYKTVAPLPGWDMVAFTGVADNGTVIGYCGMALDPGTREPVFYTELTGLVKMNEYLYEYYNIDLQKLGLYVPIAISRDGSIQTGFFNDDSGYSLPWYNKLGSAPILPRARKISARAARGTLEVTINWQQPFKSEHTLKGYNIYRDDETSPLNETLLPVSTQDYSDKPAAGRHTYYIVAVYDNDASMKAASNTVQVVQPGECFPVQSVGHRLEYNRYATIFWGQPSSEVAALAKNDRVSPTKEPKGKFNLQLDAAETAAPETAQMAATPRPKSYTSTTLDYIANVDMLTYSGFAGIKIGDYYYTSSHLGGGIQVLDKYNEIVRVITHEGLGAVMAMVYDDESNTLYCGTLTGIKSIDLDNDKMDIIAPVSARFLAYVPELDGGKGGFVAGREHSCNTYTMDGELIEADILNFRSPIYACGAAYHNGRLYVSSASGKYYNEIYVFDFEKRTQIGEPIQVVEDPALYDFLTFDGLLPLTGITQAGSLSVCTLEDGTTALGAVFQCAYITTRLMLLEIESDASVKGYDLYRSFNGGAYQKLNGDTPLATRRYSETLTEAGKYAYYVVVLPQNADAPESAASPVDTVKVAATADCPKPTFTIRESNRWTVLDWM